MPYEDLNTRNHELMSVAALLGAGFIFMFILPFIVVIFVPSWKYILATDYTFHHNSSFYDHSNNPYAAGLSMQAHQWMITSSRMAFYARVLAFRVF